MEGNLVKHEDNIAKILDRVISLCKKNGFSELAEKGENTLKKFNQAKKLT